MISCSLTGVERCLNGKCALNGKCICDNGWTGNRCEKCDFLQTKFISSFFIFKIKILF